MFEVHQHVLCNSLCLYVGPSRRLHPVSTGIDWPLSLRLLCTLHSHRPTVWLAPEIINGFASYKKDQMLPQPILEEM